MKQLIRKTRPATRTSACIFAATALLLASCSQDELSGTGDTTNAPHGISALHIASASLQAPEAQPGTRSAATRSAATTRATESATLTAGSIGIFRSQGTGYTETQDNKQYTYDAANGEWQPSTAANTVYLMANDADVCAYYPYNSASAYTDKTALPLASGKYKGDITNVDDLTATYDPADLCYATNRPMNGANVTTTFEMQHAMAMVQLSFVRLNYASTACNLTSVSIKNKELISTATLDITNGTYTTVKKAVVKWTPGTADAVTDNPATGIQVPASGVSEITTALLVPCTLDAAGFTTFTFTVDGLPMSVKVPAAKLPAFEAGKIHKLKFTIHAASVSLSEVSVIDWINAWNDADIPAYDGVPKDYIELGGVKWALSDLTYNSIHYTYGFALSPTVAGTSMQWNAMTDADAGNSTDSWIAENDPCALLEPKKTWQTPTKEDVAALIALPRVWTNNYQGAMGWWFGSDNAEEIAFAPERFLFLPAGSTGPVGYWTQTYGTNHHPLSLSINSASVVENENVAYDTPLKVRCVNKPVVQTDYIEIAGAKWAKGNLYQTADGQYHVMKKQGDFYNATISPVIEWEGYIQYLKYAWDSPDGSPSILPLSEDKCRKVTDGEWCVPTKEQHEALINQPHVFGSYVNSGGYSVKGMYFGTTDKAVAESHQDKYLFLPYTGFNGSNLMQVGEGAVYMNTYYRGNGDLSQWGIGKYMSHLEKTPEEVGSLSYMYDIGSSVRCVKATDLP